MMLHSLPRRLAYAFAMASLLCALFPVLAALAASENGAARNEINTGQIQVAWPVFDNAAVDTSIKRMVDDEIASFRENIDGLGDADRDLYEQYSLEGSYEISRPGPEAVSVLFTFYSFTGGAHGMTYFKSLNFDMNSGRELDFADLFGDPGEALKLMSALCAEKLIVEMAKDEWDDEDWVRRGTAPDVDNFQNLLLLPDGLEVYFQPYVVGPYAAGTRSVRLTLKELEPARPSAEVWMSATKKPLLPFFKFFSF